MTEHDAIKVEIAAAIKRRITADGRPTDQLFGIALAAFSESLADLIFAAAKSETSARTMLATVHAIVEQRWRHLASQRNNNVIALP